MQTSIKMRISEELKNDATDVLRDCGMTVSSAIRLFLEQVVRSQGLPFEVKRPSAKMQIALQEAREIEESAQHRYDSIDSMFKGLNADEQQEK
ncbi:type II toxin-antitoxin system RelB/DinJ family antitoxin [Erwiniaceae bacterium BAC15a-03b]|uniref:Type II toxin-antitoxin system RelB/DinJ family antitoxin n=1 Tax=Winslowiella arboricola TaxID=2978220 RepID=A0A9J6PV21_9GAMM|nr:type II toxin-antitoxin system RelB/DinJ family antitoxin [Winslowiella arboricola]MCU5775625.1 type II toxin-antitoxin system RelB/DinJ family antitoxin [Winslowiella arboricola]MCU5779525.1 type II toxin-antitoxin system RelB/DinJ family antitoxin [Winslowiella arboricola]